MFMDPAKITAENRAIMVDFNGAAIWEKYAFVKSHPVVGLLQTFASAVSGMNIFKSSYIRDARVALEFEAGRLAELRNAGFNAPKVLDHDANWAWMTLSDMGDTVAHIVKKTDMEAEHRQNILVRAAESLAVLHGYGHYHGRPSMRDLTLNKRGIGFIDLEHNPLMVMSLAETQARDAFLFLLDATWAERDNPKLMPLLIAHYAKIAPPDAIEALDRTARALRPILAPLQYLPGGQPRAGVLINALVEGLQDRRPAARGAVHKAGPRV